MNQKNENLIQNPVSLAKDSHAVFITHMHLKFPETQQQKYRLYFPITHFDFRNWYCYETVDLQYNGIWRQSYLLPVSASTVMVSPALPIKPLLCMQPILNRTG